MQTSLNGIAFIEANEGFCPTVRPDNRGPMIGFGHDLQPGETFPDGITPADAAQLLLNDLHTRFEPAVNRLADPSCTQNQFDALVDFCYNLGPGDLATMLHHGWAAVPVQMLAWVYGEIDGVEQKLPGLEARRAKEVALFNS